MRAWPMVVALSSAGCTMIAGLDDDYQLGEPATSSVATSSASTGGAHAGGGGGSGPLGPFGAPQPLGNLNSLANEDDPTLTGDLLEVYFDSNRMGTSGASDIWCSKRMHVDDAWPTPEVVMELNSSAAETSAEVSADGLTMFLSTNRGGGDFDIYMSRRESRDLPWSTPEPVDVVNSVLGDYAVAFTPDLLHLVFSSTRGASFDLFGSRRMNESAMWSRPMPLESLNGEATIEADPWIDPSGTILYFMSDRRGASGEIFMTTRASIDAGFDAPTIVDEISGPGYDQDPWLSPDMRTVVFASDISGTLDLYIATR